MKLPSNITSIPEVQRVWKELNRLIGSGKLEPVNGLFVIDLYTEALQAVFDKGCEYRAEFDKGYNCEDVKATEDEMCSPIVVAADMFIPGPEIK